MAQTPWRDPDRLAGILRWVDERLAERGVRRIGDAEQVHDQWWATALRVPTSDGVVWCKAVQPSYRFEGPLTALLASVRPDLVVEVLAVGEDLLLTADGGTPLRVRGPALDEWGALLPRYAALQLELAPRRAELLELGVPDLGLDVLPRLLELPDLAARCAELGAAGIPETVQHDDLHDGNVLHDGRRTVVFDWGDACVSHPFHTLCVTLRALAYRHGLVPGGRDVLRLRDAYLEPFTAVLDRAALQEAAELARRTGTAQRAAAWQLAAASMPAGPREDALESADYGRRLYALDLPWGGWDDGTV